MVLEITLVIFLSESYSNMYTILGFGPSITLPGFGSPNILKVVFVMSPFSVIPYRYF